MMTRWSRILIGIGVIIAFLALGALEVLTARLPGGEGLTGQASSDSGAGKPWRDYLDLGGHETSEEPDAGSVPDRSEADGAAVLAQGRLALQ